MNTILNIDKNIILSINDALSSNDFLVKFFTFITHLSDGGAIWIAIGIYLILKKQTRQGGILLLSTLAIASTIGNSILKNIFERQRPFLTLGLTPFIEAPHSFSFPSGHSLASFAGATIIFYLNKKWGILAYILAILTAISRVVLMVHYPTDVITGAIIGTVCSVIIILIFKKIKQYYNK